MLKISDFSKLSRISVRMLRYYDKNDILKPVLVKENGYRYYDSKQLLTAVQIQYLRYLGFSTAKIKSILMHCQNSEEIKDYLYLQLAELNKQKKMITEQINALTLTINKINQEEIIMNYQVEVKEISKKYMMCKRGIIPEYAKEDLLWKGLFNELQERNMNVDIVDHGSGMAFYHDEGFKERNVNIEIAIEVNGEYEDSENIKFKTIPATKVVSVIFYGKYENIGDVTCSIAKWINEHEEVKIKKSPFCIYHVGYIQTNNQEEFVTEVCYPIQ